MHYSGTDVGEGVWISQTRMEQVPLTSHDQLELRRMPEVVLRPSIGDDPTPSSNITTISGDRHDRQTEADT